MIAGCHLVMERGGRRVLDGVNFRAREGHVTAILGANGAGKSTLLRVLTGELTRHDGVVSFARRPLAEWTPRELALRRAVVPQASALSFPFRVIEVVMQGCAPHGEGRAANEAAALSALEAVDMAAHAARDYTTLSGGERQRVHLARALAQVRLRGEGRALFLDEPTASLDLRHQHDVLGVARRFADSGGCVVIVLHDLNLCARYADKVFLLHYGRLLGAGDVTAVMTPEWLGAAYGIPVRRLDTKSGPLFEAVTDG
jgi:iron complex transport system ATP-binding protein